MLHSILKFCNYNPICLCEWSQCNFDENIIDIEYFWEAAITIIGRDVCGGDRTNQMLLEKTRTLYNPKTFVWTKMDDTYAFTIGFNPTKKFHVQTRLDHVNSNTFIEMTVEELEKLFAILQQTLSVNILYPSKETNVATVADISITEEKFKKYKIRMNYNTFHINESNLRKFLKQKQYFTTLVQQYENERTSYEKNFLHLLCMCWKHLNAVDFDDRGVKTLDLSSLLMEVWNSPCSCAPKPMIIETATHFFRLLKKWVPVYRKLQLLSEVARAETFEKHWPHTFIEGKELAKFGFYYAGPLDKVKCVFCKLILHKWTPKDNPLDEHLKHNLHCPLMNVDVPCRNIPKTSTDINKMLLGKENVRRKGNVVG